MPCVEWRERIIQDHRRFRCRACDKQFNERSTRLLNRARRLVLADRP